MNDFKEFHALIGMRKEDVKKLANCEPNGVITEFGEAWQYKKAGGNLCLQWKDDKVSGYALLSEDFELKAEEGITLMSELEKDRIECIIEERKKQAIDNPDQYYEEGKLEAVLMELNSKPMAEIGSGISIYVYILENKSLYLVMDF